MIRALFLLLFLATPANAFNALGHKVIADIAWRNLDSPTRLYIVKVLRRHPRFDSDFAIVASESRWIFQHAATWPDQIRGNSQYDHPTWHYVNFPCFVGRQRPHDFNLEMELKGDVDNLNVAQAIVLCRKIVASNAPPSEKALAYCWLFHLVGDLHQPLHTTAMVSERFPDGDRGGNAIPTMQGRNLHALWDNLLGSDSLPSDVKREVAELRNRPWLWQVDTSGSVSDWIRESHLIAKTTAYSPYIISPVQVHGELLPINLADTYLQTAGQTARQQIVAAGLRLAAILRQ